MGGGFFSLGGPFRVICRVCLTRQITLKGAPQGSLVPWALNTSFVVVLDIVTDSVLWQTSGSSSGNRTRHVHGRLQAVAAATTRVPMPRTHALWHIICTLTPPNFTTHTYACTRCQSCIDAPLAQPYHPNPPFPPLCTGAWLMCCVLWPVSRQGGVAEGCQARKLHVSHTHTLTSVTPLCAPREAFLPFVKKGALCY